MNIQTIHDYHEWADRNYVSPLVCKNHEFHRLLPSYEDGTVILTCPRGDYKRTLGKIEYKQLEQKIAMAKWLWENR